MICSFKGFFSDPSDAEAAYYALCGKHIVSDLETSELVSERFTNSAPQIAYGIEASNFITSNGIAGSGTLTAGSLSNNDPRVAMTPFLENDLHDKEKEASMQDAYHLHGHCRKKDLSAVTACLRHYGAFSVLSSDHQKPPRIHRFN